MNLVMIRHMPWAYVLSYLHVVRHVAGLGNEEGGREAPHTDVAIGVHEDIVDLNNDFERQTRGRLHVSMGTWA
jgi:hypothetical protein